MAAPLAAGAHRPPWPRRRGEFAGQATLGLIVDSKEFDPSTSGSAFQFKPCSRALDTWKPTEERSGNATPNVCFQPITRHRRTDKSVAHPPPAGDKALILPMALHLAPVMNLRGRLAGRHGVANGIASLRSVCREVYCPATRPNPNDVRGCLA